MNTLYRMFDAENHLLYVGVSCRGARRFDEHNAKSWWPAVSAITVQHFPDRNSALDAEAAALVTESPLHNLAGVPARTCGMPTRCGFPCRAVTDGGPCFTHGGVSRFLHRTHRAGMLGSAHVAANNGGGA
jgi:hypothetical protein